MAISAKDLTGMTKEKGKEKPAKPSELEIRQIIKSRLKSSLLLWGIAGLIIGLVLVFSIKELTFLKALLWGGGSILVSEIFIGLPWFLIDSFVIEKWELRGYNVKKMKIVSTISFIFIPFWLLIALIFLWYDRAAEHEYFKNLAKKS